MVDLGGYIIILTNDDGKIKLYGSPADNVDTLEVSDEILEVNGRTLENATHNEVIQYIHQCIKSRTICLRLRRSGNKMEELDGPNAGRIRDAWVIAVERSARERLQKLTALKKIQPRDIQAILHQRINDAVASTSEDSTSKDVSNGQITVTLADKELGTNAFSTKLSNGTIPKGLGKEADIRVEDTSQERKDALEKQPSYEEANLLLPVQSGRIGERRASSPFQNGRTEVLIGEPEGGPRSPRGSTSSAVSDGNFLNPLDERDEPICRSRRRSGSGVTDIHSQQQQQQLQLQENNNSSSRDAKKPQEGLGPDEMWAPGALGHHRELPVDVPDTLLQKAYPNKVKNCSSNYRNELHRPRSASDLDLSLNLKNETLKTRTIADGRARRARLESNDRAHDVTDAATRTINVPNGLQPSMLKIELNIEDEEEKVKATRKNLGLDKYRDSPIATGSPDLKSTFKAFEVYANVDEDAGGQKEESSVDIEDDYPFAKEDYPTMLKTCSDDSASPRSSSGRSDSTAPLDTSLMLRHSKNHKDSPTYDVRRIDLGSPCRSVMPDIKVAPLFGRTRDTTSFDNPAYGLTDLQDLQGLLRSDEMSDLTRLIDEQSPIPRTPQDQDNVSPVRVKDQQTELSQTETANKSGKSPTKRRTNDERAKLKAKTRSLDIEELIRAGSTDDLLGIELSNLSSSSSSCRQRPKKKRHQQISSGYSTLRSEASGDLEHNAERSFLVVGRKPYREVAVDCPPDFVPVTKCHPIYPPPNKTPGNSKHNTLEPKRDRAGVANEESSCAATTTTTTMTTTTTTLVASPRLSPNDNSFTTLSSADGSAKETVIARTVDRKHSLKKVRSRVKSLICDSLQSILHHEHGISLSAYRTLNAPTQSHSGDPVLRSFVMKTENFNEFPQTRNSFDERDGKLFRDRGVENPCFEDDFSRRSFLESKERPLSSVLGEELPKNCQNPFLGKTKTNNMTSSPFLKATGDSMCLNRRSLSGFQDKVVSSCQEKLLDFEKETEEVIFSDCSNEIKLLPKEGIAFFKIADHPANIPDQLSFIQETNQNSRNSLREFSSAKKRVGRCLSNNTRFSDNFCPQEKERDSPHCLDDSPKTQNEKNSRLSFEYECSKLLDVPSMLSNNGVKFRVSWRSTSDLSNLTVGCHSVIKKRSSSFPNFVSMPEITFSRSSNGGDKVDHPVVLHDGLPDERTKQSAPKSPMYTLKNCSLKSHVDALEQQVNYNGLCLSLETFARRIIRTASLHFGNLHALQSNFAVDCLLNYLIKFIILVVFLDAKGRDLSMKEILSKTIEQ